MKKSGNRKAESGKRKTGNGGPGSADVLVGRYEPIDSSLGPQPLLKKRSERRAPRPSNPVSFHRPGGSGVSDPSYKREETMAPKPHPSHAGDERGDSHPTNSNPLTNQSSRPSLAGFWLLVCG